MIKKSICIFLCAVVLFCALAFPGSAEASDIRTSDVMSDLSEMMVGGIKFNESLYPKNLSLTHIQILSFLEYGYDYSGNQSNYGIFVYVYNPSCKNIAKSNRNTIQIGTVKDESQTPVYRKYQLDEVSRSTCGRFIKYVIRDVKIPNSVNSLYDVVDSAKRIYKVSGVELLTEGQYQPTDYAVSGTYVYTGYGKGFRQDKQAESTLYCKVEELLTIRLDLKSTVWRSATSSLGVGHQNEVASVYFSIGNQILDTYGNLYAITAEWEEYKVESIVTELEDMVLQYEGYIGDPMSSLPGYVAGDKNPDFYSFDVGYRYTPSYSGIASVLTKDIGLNSNFPSSSSMVHTVKYDITTVPYMYYVKEISNDYGVLDVMPEEVLKNIQKYGFYPLDHVDEGRTMGYNRYYAVLGETFSLLNDSYKSTHSWWDYVTKHGLLGWSAIPDESFDDVEPIVKVTDYELRGSDKAVSDRLFVHESDVDNLSAYYQAQTALDKSVFLFRFSATDYYQGSGVITLGESTRQEYDEYDAYYAKQTVYKNFDVIDLTFKDDHGAFTVIPVVSDPLDISGGIGGSPDPSDKAADALLAVLKSIIAVLLGLAFVFGVVLLVDYVFKILNNGVSLFSKISSKARSSPKRRKRYRK